MKAKWILVSGLALGLLLAVILVPALAQGPDRPDVPDEDLAVDAIVSSKFSYQGRLSEAGSPVNGLRDMIFRLYTNDTCTTQVGSNITRNDVPVSNGLFSVELNVSASNFNGQGIWLGIEIEGTEIGCQEILPVPYALSLRPGAIITGNVPNWDVIHAVNTAATGLSFGVYGVTNSSSGTGVYARGVDAGADLILAGNASTTSGDDGVLTSDPSYASSDLVFLTNDGIRIELDNDADGEDADIDVQDKDGSLIFSIDESGNVTFGGSGVGAFPRPAYNSGWQSLGLGATRTLTHNLGGSVDNYVVDLTCDGGGVGLNNWGVGGDANWEEYYGAWWYSLTASQITIRRWSDDTDCPQVRVRIWMYP